MGPGDLLALYTDGVTEAANAEDEEFGTDRLVATLRELRPKPLPELEADARRAAPRVHGRDAVRGRPHARPPQARLAGSGSVSFASRGSIPCLLSISLSVVGLRPRSSAAFFWTPFARASAAASSERS